VVFNEVYTANRLYDVDEATFFLVFIGQLTSERQQEVRANNERLRAFHKSPKYFIPKSIYQFYHPEEKH